MTKLIALAVAGLFAAGTMFAGDHGNCAKTVGNDGKMACHVSMASLNLTAAQKTKMDFAIESHKKAGCTKENEAKFMTEAKDILTADQYAKFKAECDGAKDKTGA